MALTTGTTQPFTFSGLSRGGTHSSGVILDFPVTASDTYKVGDIVTLASGVAHTLDTAQGDAVILGIAMPKGVAFQATNALHTQQVMGATVDFPDKILVGVALPGTIFEGNLVAGAATNYTANTAVIAGANPLDTVLGTDTYAAWLHINTADTTGGGATSIAQINVLRYCNTQLHKTTLTPTTFTFTTTNVVNPRVDFVFRTTYFNALV